MSSSRWLVQSQIQQLYDDPHRAIWVPQRSSLLVQLWRAANLERGLVRFCSSLQASHHKKTHKCCPKGGCLELLFHAANAAASQALFRILALELIKAMCPFELDLVSRRQCITTCKVLLADPQPARFGHMP